MKKFLLFMMITFLFTLSACGQDTQGIPENNSQNTTEEHSQHQENDFSGNNSDDKFITFHVNDSLPEYKATITYSKENAQLAESLVITEKESGKQIQQINLLENEIFTKEPLYVIDISFDGNLDLLIPYQKPASAVYFQGYVWNTEENSFIYAPSFENLSNFALDNVNKLILSHRTASMITSYSMSYYDNDIKDFVLQNSLYWETSNTDQILHFVEEQLEQDSLKIIAEYSITTNGSVDIDKTNQNISPYFEKDSFWDLDAKKWEFCLSDILNIN